MRILFETKKVTKPNYLPKLKPGVEAFEIGANRIYVGNIKAGIQLEQIPISLIRAFNGRKTLKSLSEISLVDSDLIEDLIALLLEKGLIDIYPTRMVFEERYLSKLPTRANSAALFANDIAIRDFEMRVAAEAAITTWRPGIDDGGRSALSMRQKFPVLILGDEELSISTYFALVESGFNRINLNLKRELQMDDLRTGHFSLTDVGRELMEVLAQRIKERQLFKSLGNAQEQVSEPQLIIYFGRPGTKLIQEWMSQELAHIVIESIGPNLLVGPLVIPGKSPCLNCVSLVDTKILRNLKEISAFQRPALAAINLITGYLSLAIAEFVDTGSSPLVGSAKVFDLVNPNEIRELKYPRHPACGCNWL